ncbi:YybH family protein [Amycolatopsis jejuensis]|uniref:YybH family protein n=1 Tax=Amycolatopsis jejuensis TaxID=330084 RepID=UPI000690548A|nr:nuclear transport factor 2 family protein [Amycolatopsis jejuensis]
MSEEFAAMMRRFESRTMDLGGSVGKLAEESGLADDFTLFGGFGGALQQPSEIHDRAALALARFSEGTLRYENLRSGHSGDLGYAVGVEHGRVTGTGAAAPTEFHVRVTHLFRRTDGTWKMIHRHADTNAERMPAERIAELFSGTAS